MADDPTTPLVPTTPTTPPRRGQTAPRTGTGRRAVLPDDANVTTSDDERPDERPWKVTDKTGRRRLFEGTEEQARAYVEAHFPRVHAEPGVDYGDDGPEPDVLLVSPNNEEHRWHGADSGWHSDNDDTDDDEE